MQAIYLALFGFVAFYLGYRLYSKFIAEKIFRLDPNFKTPAHEFEDGIDYVPTNKHVLWGHHFTSVAGAAPIVGPAIAVIWGWLPALLWVVFGTIFFAGVHDFGTLWASVRHKGQSMGSMARTILGKRGQTLFMLILLLLLLMVNAVFAVVIANLFTAFPGAVFPIWMEVPVALGIGWWAYKKKGGLLWPSIAALVALYVFVYFGNQIPITLPESVLGFGPKAQWIIIMLIYGVVASMLPVWTLLQPGDYINSHQLFVGLGILYLGMFLVNPKVVAPALNTAVPAGTPPILPLLFITIACGAISGFHGLVSSGTSSKQLDKEPDARQVGYLGAVGEGLLALGSILAATAAFGSLGEWQGHYASWAAAGGGATKAFVTGVAKFAGGLGIPADIGQIFASVLVISFAATTMDTGMRLQRYIIAELGETFNIKFLTNGTVATIAAGLSTALLAFGADPKGGAGGMIIWPLFGTTNQLVAGLSLLLISLYLKKLKRPTVYTLAPMIFLLAMTTIGMFQQVGQWMGQQNWLLTVMGSIVLVLELWLMLEAFSAFRRIRTEGELQAAD